MSYDIFGSLRRIRTCIKQGEGCCKSVAGSWTAGFALTIDVRKMNGFPMEIGQNESVRDDVSARRSRQQNVLPPHALRNRRDGRVFTFHRD